MLAAEGGGGGCRGCSWTACMGTDLGRKAGVVDGPRECPAVESGRKAHPEARGTDALLCRRRPVLVCEGCLREVGAAQGTHDRLQAAAAAALARDSQHCVCVCVCVCLSVSLSLSLSRDEGTSSLRHLATSTISWSFHLLMIYGDEA